MKLLIILPAKIQAETPFLQRCKEQVVKYSLKMVWKVHPNLFVAKVFSLKTSGTLVLQTCINGMETGITISTINSTTIDCKKKPWQIHAQLTHQSTCDNLGWKVLRILHFRTHRTPILWIWCHYGASPRTTLVSVVQTGSEMIQQRFSRERGEYLQLPVLSGALSSI